MKQLYEQKGYPKEWIDKRLRGIAVRTRRDIEAQSGTPVVSSANFKELKHRKKRLLE